MLGRSRACLVAVLIAACGSSSTPDDAGGETGDAGTDGCSAMSEECNALDDDCDGTVDEGVTPNTYYADCDGDGYPASGAETVEGCGGMEAPVGCVGGGRWTMRAPSGGLDCNDENPVVHPNQSIYFQVPIDGAPPESDFDYDCDGVEERRWPELGTSDCVLNESTRMCEGHAGWQDMIPDCGEPGTVDFQCIGIADEPSGMIDCMFLSRGGRSTTYQTCR